MFLLKMASGVSFVTGFIAFCLAADQTFMVGLRRGGMTFFYIFIWSLFFFWLTSQLVFGDTNGKKKAKSVDKDKKTKPAQGDKAPSGKESPGVDLSNVQELLR